MDIFYLKKVQVDNEENNSCINCSNEAFKLANQTFQAFKLDNNYKKLADLINNHTKKKHENIVDKVIDNMIMSCIIIKCIINNHNMLDI